ncbi:hypothetical protein FM076_26890 [Streptomyces albus subsp. chlorinus]|nr:hypothetical protein [Streptomyces albus subsp. chlorinus]
MATVTVPAHNPQGPQGPHHPGDPQHTPPSGQWAPPPGGLPGPGGPYPVHAGPAAPHPGKRGRGVLLGALGVVLALVSGGGTFLALQVFGQGGDEGGKSGPGARRSPTADGGGTVKKPSPKDISSPAPDGALPRGYLGAWQGTVQEADGSTITRRFEIRQGDEGEVVAKTFNLRSDMLCEGEATLVSFDGGEAGLRITSRITESHPADNPCVPYKEQTLRLHADGTLSWTYPASSLSAKLHRVGDPARPVPGWMAGEWESAGASGGRTLTIGRGRAGEATLRVRDEADGGVCEFEAQLAGADGDTLSYGPQTIAHDGTDSGCGTSGSYTSTVTAVGHDQLRFTMAGESGGMVFRRAGSS